jgi:hypothetical protein
MFDSLSVSNTGEIMTSTNYMYFIFFLFKSLCQCFFFQFDLDLFFMLKHLINFLKN